MHLSAPRTIALCVSSTEQSQFPRLFLFSSPLSCWKPPAMWERAEAAAAGCTTKRRRAGGSLHGGGVPPRQSLPPAAATCPSSAASPTDLTNCSKKCEPGCKQGSSHRSNSLTGGCLTGRMTQPGLALARLASRGELAVGCGEPQCAGCPGSLDTCCERPQWLPVSPHS